MRSLWSDADAAAFKPWVFEPPDTVDVGARTRSWAFEPPAEAGSPAEQPLHDDEPNWVEMVPGFDEDDADSWEPSEPADVPVPQPVTQPVTQPSSGPWVDEEDWDGYRSTAPRWLIPLLTIVLLAVLSAAIYVLGR